MTDLRNPAGRLRHDLINQLGVILGFSGLLLQDFDPSDARHSDIKEVHAAAERALELLARARFIGEDEQS